MAARAYWKGQIRLALVSIPVEIYRATRVKLFGICLRILGDRKEAEDALQDVYVNLWQRADRYDPARASPIAWLAAFARNRAIDRLRTGKVR